MRRNFVKAELAQTWRGRLGLTYRTFLRVTWSPVTGAWGRLGRPRYVTGVIKGHLWIGVIFQTAS